jgi:hypothetical protein
VIWRPAPRAFRVVGWLLTPLVAWAASFLGAWLGAAVGRRFPLFLGGVEWMVAGGVLGGATALTIWIHRLRRGRRLWQEAKALAAKIPVLRHSLERSADEGSEDRPDDRRG